MPGRGLAGRHQPMRLKPAWYVPVVRNLPAEDWPIWAVVASLFRAAEDAGVGDTLAREFGGSKSERFKAHHEVVFGLWQSPCGCGGKVAQWNRLYPYEKAPAAGSFETGFGGGLSAGKTVF